MSSPSTVSPFPPRPRPPSPSPSPSPVPSAPTESTPSEAPPPPLPPKLPPPPPPSDGTFIVPVSSLPPQPSTFRQRDTSNPFTHVRRSSRSTSVDFGPSFSSSSLFPFEMDDAPHNGGHTLLLLNTDKDLPEAREEEGGSSGEEEAEGLLGTPSSSRRPSRRRRKRQSRGSADTRRRRLRLLLVVLAGLALLVVLFVAGRATELGGKVEEKVRAAVQGMREKLGGATGGGARVGGGGSVSSEGGLEEVVYFKEGERQKGEPVEEGGDGDWVRLENGTVVQYRNAFGGRFSTSRTSLTARAQDDVPPLSEEWDFEKGRMRGVNLGGWLTLEPFITPSLFEPYLNASHPAVDEWTLSENLRREGGVERLEEVLRGHYESFVTELDFLAIAQAGLSWVRLPVPYWALKTWGGGGKGRREGMVEEPFLEGVAWEYVLRALLYSRKYGLRLNFDLHSVPGSQNGWNHSGRLGYINVLHGPMGYANAQRALDYVREVAGFLAREEVRHIIPMYSLLNEPMLAVIGPDALRSFYAEAYETVRNVTGYGKGKGPFLALHDGFKGTRRWYNFLESRPLRSSPSSSSGSGMQKFGSSVDGLDRVALDSHRYLAFAEPDLREVGEQVMKPCLKWAPEFNKTATSFGLALSGEWALAVNDCGRFLNNVFEGTRLEGTFPSQENPLYPPSAPEGTCEFWEDYTAWTDDFKAELIDLALAQMDTFQNWFYWTWKTTPSLLIRPSLAANPLWSYSLGLQEGFIPRDPREAHDFCFSYPLSERARRKAAEKVKNEDEEGDDELTTVPKRVPLGRLKPWKVGDAVSSSSSSSAGTTEPGHLSPAAKARERVAWPPLEFDSPAGEFGAGGVLVSRLPRYARTGRGLVLPGPDDEGSRRVPREASEEEEREASEEEEREGGLGKWFEPIEGCEGKYPQDAWDTADWEVGEGEVWCDVEGAVGE